MFSKRAAFTKTNWAITLALLAVLVLSTAIPAFAAAKLRVGKVTIGTQSGALTYGVAANVTYSVAVTAATGQAAGIVNFSVTGLPAGVSLVSFSPSTLTLSAGQSGSTTLTLHSDGAQPAGTSSFTVNALGSNTKSVGGSLLVGKKTATITANNLPKEYGASYVFTGTEFTPGGFISGDNVSSVTLSSAGAAASATVGSPYPITPSAAIGTGLANYNIQYVAGNMTVTPRPLSVTGVVGINKVYDGLLSAAVDASGASLSGVLGSDVVNLDKGAATGAFLSPDVANGVTIQVAGLTISGANASNYSLIQPTTTANITPATATVTPNLAFMVAGGTEPTYTVTYGDFVNGETSAVVTTDPTCSVPVPHTAQGNYDIVCSGAAAQNYIFDYVNVNGALYVSAANNPPTDIVLPNNSVAERLAPGAIVGNLSTDDLDSVHGESYSYTLSNAGACAGLGTDNGSFSIPSGFSTIPVPLQTTATLHYVTKSTYNICVEVNDGYGGILDKPFTVNVLPSQLTLNSWDINDGWIVGSASSTTGISSNTIASTLVVGDDKANKQYRSFLTFRTGPIDDNATILGISLRIKKVTLTNPNLFTVLNGLRVDVAKPYFGNSLSLQLTDFGAPESFRNACMFSSTPDVNGWYSTPGKCLNALPYINKVGPTQFRLRFAYGTNSNGVADYLSFYSGNAGPLSQPQLVITYSVP